MMPQDKDSFCTPSYIIDVVLDYFGGRIDLDPCSNPQSIVPAVREIMLPDDGLEIPWGGHTFVNPPYSRGNIPRWVDKAIKEARAGRADIVLLLPADTATAVWQGRIFGQILTAYRGRICFLDHRVRFLGGETSARFSSALVCIEALRDQESAEPKYPDAVLRRLGHVIEDTR